MRTHDTTTTTKHYSCSGIFLSTTLGAAVLVGAFGAYTAQTDAAANHVQVLQAQSQSRAYAATVAALNSAAPADLATGGVTVEIRVLAPTTDVLPGHH